jgi:hypothetical protein
MSEYGAISRNARNTGCLFEATDPRRRINRKGLAEGEDLKTNPLQVEGSKQANTREQRRASPLP